MNNNVLVTEVRKRRAEILASYGGDFHVMMRDMMRRQWDSGHPVVNLAESTGTQPLSAAKPKSARAKS